MTVWSMVANESERAPQLEKKKRAVRGERNRNSTRERDIQGAERDQEMKPRKERASDRETLK